LGFVSFSTPTDSAQSAYIEEMRMTVLASGSKGNSTVIASARTRVLVDAGLSCRELLRRMAIAGEDPAKLDAILVTHEHVDHIAGLPVLARKLGIPVFFTESTHRAWVRMMTPRTTMTYAKWLDHIQQEKLARAANASGVPSQPVQPSEVGSHHPAPAVDIAAEAQVPVDPDAESEDCEPATAARVEADPTFLPAVEYFQAGRQFSIGDLAICPFTIPHDAADPCGFVFEAEGIRMAVATDLGYMPPNVKSALKRIDVLLLESNHDLEMLRVGPYPWSVKQRVMSRRGHLSNEVTADFIRNDLDTRVSTLILGHISEHNNHPELVRNLALKALNGRTLFTKLVVAEPGVQSEVFAYQSSN